MRKRVNSTQAVERIPLEGCMKIIVIDDHILFREAITLQINRQADMSVVGVGGSVRDAADLARKLRPDLILMDFSLPDGTGLDAAQFILSEQPNAKIVFLTTHDDDERLFSAVRMGARGYLLKNIPVTRLLAALRGVERGEAAISREMTARLMDEFARANQPADAHAFALPRADGARAAGAARAGDGRHQPRDCRPPVHLREHGAQPHAQYPGENGGCQPARGGQPGAPARHRQPVPGENRKRIS